MKGMLTLATALVVATPAAAQRAESPADATVFIRLAGRVHLEIDDGLFKRSVDVDQAEIGTGSGFVISPHGYVLTNEHVVSNDQVLVTRGAQQVRVTLNVSTIQVCFRTEAAARHGLSAPCVSASVVATDPTLDLAVLFISGSDFPYIALGDSDAVAAGLPVDALGYPLGRDVEIAKVTTAADFVPDVSTTPGAVSALRVDDAGARRYLQISNTLNPGNSGGPIVTRDGFAVGVARMRLKNATGIGFAIPINQAKDFLESRGVDQSLPVRRLRLGGFHNIETKRVGLRLPEGLADTSPFRSRVESDSHGSDVVLRIDRVLSPWSLNQIAQTLVRTQAFETTAMTPRESRTPTLSGTPLLLGGAVAADSQQELWMDYGLLNLGSEKLVARYVGPAEWMAFNESVLRESLASLQGQSWGARELVPEKLEWSATRSDADGRGILPVPAGWMVTSSGPSRCPGLPQPATVSTALPADDFAFALRAAAWPAGDVVPEAAAARCSSRRGSLGAASYVTRAEWLGVPYVIEGVFALIGPGQVVQLEVSSTDDKTLVARTLLAAWLQRAAQ